MKLFLTSKGYSGLHYEENESEIQPHNYQIKYFVGPLKLKECLKELEYYQIVGIVNNPNNNTCEGYIVYDNINYQSSYMIMD